MTAEVPLASALREKPAAPIATESRLYYLDWLRVLIIGMVFVGHVMMPFIGVPWLIRADTIAPLSGLIAAVGNQFAMPVMFLISGAGAFFSLRKRAPARYAKERLLRLGLPYVVFALLLSPIQGYYAALNQGTYSGPFFPGFLPYFFNLDGFGPRDLSFLGHYGYHIFHHPFVVVFGYYIVRLNIGALPEMVLLGVTALAATIAVVAFFIAPWNPLRMVFGMRKPSTASKAPAHGPTELG